MIGASVLLLASGPASAAGGGVDADRVGGTIRVATTGVSAEELGAAGPLALNIPGLLLQLTHIGL
jgi:hypothetical protein